MFHFFSKTNESQILHVFRPLLRFNQETQIFLPEFDRREQFKSLTSYRTAIVIVNIVVIGVWDLLIMPCNFSSRFMTHKSIKRGSPHTVVCFIHLY